MALFSPTDLKKFAATEIKKGSTNKNSGMLSLEKASKIIDEVITLKKIEGEHKKLIAMSLITGIGQNGGSNKNVGTITYTIDDYTLSNVELIKIIGSIDKYATARQFFRAIRDDVQQIAELLEEPGDLAKLFTNDHPNGNVKELTWCSNFQTNNPNCPENIRNWLRENAKQRFTK